VIDGLFRSEFGDRWKYREGITSQEDDIFRVSTDSRDLSVIDELQRIRSSSVFSNRSIMEINFSAGFLKHNVLQNSSESDSTVDFRFFFLTKSHTLGIASTFNVENTLASPDVLIIADKFAISDGTESGFTSSRESEEQANITSCSKVAAGVEREMSLLGHQVVHDGENTLLHFSCILRSKDNHLSLLEVEGNCSFADNIGDEFVGSKLSSVEDVVVSSIGEVGFKLFLGRFDQHVSHEESMITSGAHNSDSDTFFKVPTSISIDNIDFVSGIEVVFSQIFEDLE
jgi:hypothetical protein